MLRRLRFDLWYLLRPPWDTGVSPPELLAYIQNHPPGRAVDLGCGTGTNVLILARHGWQVTGVDFSPRAIRKARRRIRSACLNAQLEVGDVTQSINICDRYDLALDIGCFHLLPDRRGYLTSLTSFLRPGGHWLMYGFVRAQDHGMGLGPDDLDLVSGWGFRLLSRSDGLDRAGRPSAWFLFEKSGEATHA